MSGGEPEVASEPDVFGSVEEPDVDPVPGVLMSVDESEVAPEPDVLGSVDEPDVDPPDVPMSVDDPEVAPEEPDVPGSVDDPEVAPELDVPESLGISDGCPLPGGPLSVPDEPDVWPAPEPLDVVDGADCALSCPPEVEAGCSRCSQANNAGSSRARKVRRFMMVAFLFQGSRAATGRRQVVSARFPYCQPPDRLRGKRSRERSWFIKARQISIPRFVKDQRRTKSDVGNMIAASCR